MATEAKQNVIKAKSETNQRAAVRSRYAHATATMLLKSLKRIPTTIGKTFRPSLNTTSPLTINGTLTLLD